MKQLIGTKEIREAANQKQKVICLAKEHIVTPAAKDMAKEFGIQFSHDGQTDEPAFRNQKENAGTDSNTCNKSNSDCNQEIDIDLICMIVLEVLKQLRRKGDR